MKVLFPGSFDPLTLGHLDVIERANALAKETIVGVGVNPTKKGLFPVEKRIAMICAATAHLEGVRVLAIEGATVDAARALGADLIIKGVRGGGDTDYEAVQATVNWEVGEIDTWWIPTRPSLSYVSSSMVRELIALEKDVSRYVPPAIVDMMTDNRPQ